MNAIFLYCRTGFENECAAEIVDKAAHFGFSGFCKAKPQSGYVVFTADEPAEVALLHRQLPIGELIFCRQWFVILGMRNDLPTDNRISPLLRILKLAPGSGDQVMVGTTDTNEGKQLSPLCRKLTPLLQKELNTLKPTADEHPQITLHICFLSTHAAYAGYALTSNSEPWTMGVPRLKFPRQAPSRSTLKLEEAFLRLLTTDEKVRLLKPGMRATDLGAAPGGWTWQLVKRHMQVIAVDNANLQAELLDSGLVEHVRADGFCYRPSQPVDWMVCDIIDRPQRVVERASLWLTSGWCKQTIFNLKLPMKQRYQQTQECLTYIRNQLGNHRIAYRLACKQLYHDREEVTVFARVMD